MPPDLSLPPRAPTLGHYNDCNWDDAAFALYTLLADKVPLLAVASALEKQWLSQGNETHLVRPAAPVTAFQTLRDVVQAHIALDKGKRARSDGGAAADLEWWPTAFVVVVREDWDVEPGGLLFVFADEERGYAMDRFFFKVEDAYVMLSSLSFGDEEVARCKAVYGQEPET
ncbi:hypothetical protein BDV95DRAFT_599500 [Massariosphaeria phaeospora]|uniref:Uncharacterized protein n=1 Tax=Massariosphaeria phaeospora TaxID=100035 RepID=A0A7C8I1T9_9PLEO|nr:hypothetical protein BDV95DRAFT_599500 [Massariosphaeria phaeospora]